MKKKNYKFMGSTIKFFFLKQFLQKTYQLTF